MWQVRAGPVLVYPETFAAHWQSCNMFRQAGDPTSEIGVYAHMLAWNSIALRKKFAGDLARSGKYHRQVIPCIVVSSRISSTSHVSFVYARLLRLRHLPARLSPLLYSPPSLLIVLCVRGRVHLLLFAWCSLCSLSTPCLSAQLLLHRLQPKLSLQYD
jgi:hypothetical protein